MIVNRIIGFVVCIFVYFAVLKRKEIRFALHRFGTDAIYKPLVFNSDLVEIGYEELSKMTENALTLRFTQPVKGEAYFLSFEYCEIDEDADYEPDYPIHYHYQETESDTWNINHNIGVIQIRHSIVWKEGKEINIDEFIRVDENNSILKFSTPTTGEVYFAFVNIYEDHIEMASETEGEALRLQVDIDRYRYPLKPLVMYMSGQIGYDYSILEDYLYRIGFTKEVIATIIVMQHP